MRLVHARRIGTPRQLRFVDHDTFTRASYNMPLVVRMADLYERRRHEPNDDERVLLAIRLDNVERELSCPRCNHLVDNHGMHVGCGAEVKATVEAPVTACVCSLSATTAAAEAIAEVRSIFDIGDPYA